MKMFIVFVLGIVSTVVFITASDIFSERVRYLLPSKTTLYYFNEHEEARFLYSYKCQEIVDKLNWQYGPGEKPFTCK